MPRVPYHTGSLCLCSTFPGQCTPGARLGGAPFFGRASATGEGTVAGYGGNDLRTNTYRGNAKDPRTGGWVCSEAEVGTHFIQRRVAQASASIPVLREALSRLCDHASQCLYGGAGALGPRRKEKRGWSFLINNKGFHQRGHAGSIQFLNLWSPHHASPLIRSSVSGSPRALLRHFPRIRYWFLRTSVQDRVKVSAVT